MLLYVGGRVRDAGGRTVEHLPAAAVQRWWADDDGGLVHRVRIDARLEEAARAFVARALLRAPSLRAHLRTQEALRVSVVGTEGHTGCPLVQADLWGAYSDAEWYGALRAERDTVVRPWLAARLGDAADLVMARVPR